ncbi:YceI family protein [Aquimarina sp. LLG6339-5]|uniref:YceI family protein n=1 Tax=Aquimarina sp. LLG6339-5 TaxID=3160830 RepID=UPI00386E3CDD
MRTLKIISVVFFLLLGLQSINAQIFELDTKKSTLLWTGKAAFNSYFLKGTITAKQGTITINDTVISNLNITINMKSLDHENNDLKNHLKNEDFFEVKKYPKALFALEKTTKIENHKAILQGKLTIKGKTNLERIPVNIEHHDSGIIITFNHTIDRTKYGVNHNSPSIFKRMKENAIADEFILEGKLKFDSH